MSAAIRGAILPLRRVHFQDKIAASIRASMKADETAERPMTQEPRGAWVAKAREFFGAGDGAGGTKAIRQLLD